MSPAARAALIAAALAAMVTASRAAPTDPGLDPAADTAPCEIAAKADDAARIIEHCSLLLANEATDRADRIAALIARGGAYARIDQIDRAIDDYDAVLMFDPRLADILAARGRLWRGKGEARRAIDDFAAVLRINAQHAVRSEFKALALELERAGAMAAINNRPSFDCDKARLKVEQAICADTELMRLDREIGVAATKLAGAARNDRAAARKLREAQKSFIAARNAGFGKSGFDLRQALQARRDTLNQQVQQLQQQGVAAPPGAPRISP